MRYNEIALIKVIFYSARKFEIHVSTVLDQNLCFNEAVVIGLCLV